ncbi:unnamed protein product [Lymnaea stagnalis]|uniref:Uncharacterized protein n=1 Tax=Lymnaea stagnalis TaxID=6523 RepID=A0AAV2IK52_LYMST
MQLRGLLVLYFATLVITPSCAIQCAQSAISTACALKNNANLRFASAHVSGEKDKGFAAKNIQDMCNGNGAYTSNYCKDCKGKLIPETSVCISAKVLDYLAELAKNGSVTVNEIAGGCHMCTSLHYKGRAVDLDTRRKTEYRALCKKWGGDAPNEASHTHCEF